MEVVIRRVSRRTDIGLHVNYPQLYRVQPHFRV